MKLIYCLAGTFNAGGMERVVVGKANWLVKNGYDVIIVTTEQNGRQDFFSLEKAVKRIDLDVMYSENVTSNPFKKYMARRQKMHKHRDLMREVIEKEKPDIVISTFGNEVSFIPSFKDKSKKMAEIHFSRWYRLQLNRKSIWRLIDRYLTRQDFKILKKYDKFVCLTKEDLRNWVGLKNVMCIPNFIEIENAEKAALKENQMIAVGRLSYQKGYDRMIKAWKIVSERHPAWTLNIFGGGELKDTLIGLIDSLGLNETVIIHNPTDDIKSEYLNNSALLLSSHYEGLPMVLLEAMSYGLPLISFDCQCGPRDIIRNNANGLLVKDGDINGLAEAVIKAIESEGLRHKLGNGAKEEAKNYSIDAIMEKWTTLFNDMKHE